MKSNLTGLLLCLFLAACNQHAGSGAQPSAQPVAPEVTNTVNKDAASYIKPGASVEISGDKLLYLQPGERLDWVLNLASGEPEGELQVSLATSEGLELVSQQNTFTFNLAEEGAYTIPLSLRALDEGRYYLYIQAQVATGERSSSRALAVAVQVGDEKPLQKQSLGKQELDSEGQLLIIQDAEEDILD